MTFFFLHGLQKSSTPIQRLGSVYDDLLLVGKVCVKEENQKTSISSFPVEGKVKGWEGGSQRESKRVRDGEGVFDSRERERKRKKKKKIEKP